MLKKPTLLVAVVSMLVAGAGLAPGGDLDTGFGTAGVASTDVGGGDNVTDVLLQPDGKILVAGTIDWNGTRNPFLVRYLPDGSLDNDFGTAGLVIDSRYTQPSPRIALQPDGKILVATRNDDSPAGLLVLRFEANGAPDLDFGASGAALIASMVVSSIAGIAVGSDGVIHVGARLSVVSGEAMGIARFDADGAADTDFGEGGLLTVALAYPYLPLAFALDADSRILMAGYVFGLPGRFFTDAFVARFDPSGVLDASFGTDGIALIQQLENGTEIQALALQADGMVVAGGRAWGPAYYESRWLLARFTETGAPDLSFGSEGTVELDPSTGHDVILGIAITDDGIHVAGQTETLDRGLPAARFLPDGTLDAGFGPAGIAGVPGLPVTGFNRIAVQSDGKVVVAGSWGDAYVARYSGESAPDTTPPTLMLPPGLVADATGPAGAVITYDVAATDDFDPDPTVTCGPASGSVFSIGDTLVSCLAADASGNTQAGDFEVHVRGAAEQLAELERAVAGVGPGRSLAAIVRQASAHLRRNELAATVRSLRSFINEVNAQAGKTVPPDQATALVAAARRIAGVLGYAL